MPIGVNVREVDQSLYTNTGGNSPIAAIIGTATKGPLNKPTLIHNQIEFKDTFGLINPKHYGTYAAQWYLAESAQLYYIRVADTDTSNPATCKITTKASVDIEDGLILESNDIGSFYNGYKVKVTEEEGQKHTLSIINRDGRVMSTLKNVSLQGNNLADALENTPFRVKNIDTVSATLVEGEYLFENGNDGEENVKDEAIQALKLLDSDVMQIDLLAMPGMYDSASISAALALCEKRADTLFVADTPPNLTPQEVADWHNGKGAENMTLFNSSYGAMYYPWLYLYDQINDQEVMVPASVGALSAIARSENMSRPWYAPAGLTRGLIKNVLRAEFEVSTTAADFLYEAPNNINSIITHQTAGLAVWGQRTLYRQDTALDRINVRRLISYIKRSVMRVCQSLVFEPNDRITWMIFEDVLHPFFRGLVAQRGLYDYHIVPLSQTVTPQDIDNNKIPAQILIKPTKAAEFIPVDIIITNTGAELTNSINSVD